MKINGQDFPEIISIKRIQVKNRQSSEIFPLENNLDCIIIQHTDGIAWVHDEDSVIAPLVVNCPAFVSGKNRKDLNIRVLSIIDENIDIMNFTLIFFKLSK